MKAFTNDEIQHLLSKLDTLGEDPVSTEVFNSVRILTEAVEADNLPEELDLLVAGYTESVISMSLQREDTRAAMVSLVQLTHIVAQRLRGENAPNTVQALYSISHVGVSVANKLAA